ncbi:MAG: AMP-binding protein [Salinigranum sp.]
MSGAMTMGNVFRQAVTRFPERTAIVDPDGGVRYTYSEWNDRVNDVGAALRASGIEPGDCVGAIMENREELLTLYWAAQQLGAAFVPFNFRAAGGEVSFLTNNVGASILFFSDVSREAVLAGTDDFEATEEIVSVDEAPEGATSMESFLERGDAFDPDPVDPEDTSLILHTSGTTGNPKGVPISHRANYARTMGNPIELDWLQGEKTLGIMPNFHEMGRAAMSSAALLNGTYIAMRKWSPERACQLIEAEEIEILYLVPTLFHDLVDYEGIEDYDLSSVRTVSYAGTAMSERVHEEVREIFEPQSFTNFYGSSEMNAMATCPWLDEKPGCAGRAGIHTQVRVVTPVEGETVPPDQTVEPGELGEIILDANSAEAFDGYLNRPEANETSFEDGWYFTGDLGYKDEDGDLWVVGRVDDMIISGGENIYPVEIEDLLDSHELVADVAVGSLADDRWGEAVTAYVTVDGDVDYEEAARTLDEFCKTSDRLANFKRPRRYVFVDSVPKSNVGKKLRRKLRAEDLEDIAVNISASVEP